MRSNVESPFNWRGKPSIFAKSNDHNGVNHDNAQRQARKEKVQPVYLTGSSVYLRIPEKQMTTYSRAKAKK